MAVGSWEVEGDPNFVFDLFSNRTHRYEQYDGTWSLPYKRKQPDSVVTLPFQQPKRRPKENRISAGWIRGEEDRRSSRGRGGPPTVWGSGRRPGYGPGYGTGRGWSGRGHRGRGRRPW
jgi:hypothetical protein